MLVKGYTVPKFYWLLMIPIFIWLSSNRIFSASEWERYGLTRLEDIGHLLFDLGICVIDSLIHVLLIWLVASIFKNLFSKKELSK
ncbi:hypothetical protein M3649_09065 [Ureibacillus chungkukjangi]|uniref:hypothetical protein n=1 Tax=Ureibacillus chungkukjangi TaxID=1202712 RepID=UPI002041A5C2|nr:hypothetical protein [Ureibacillus chungkukjangi]MCM3388282.1 hypothetical protein [Ureibacillus chungkukjangi]